jgi:tetratricopeptide (TPR) repeat protein
MPELAGVDLAGCPPLVHAARVSAVSDQNAVAFQGDRPDEGLRDYAMWAALDSGLPHMWNHVWQPFVLWSAWTGREAEASAVIEEMAANTRRLGAPPDPYVLYLRPYLLWQRGELEDAAMLVRHALRYPHLDQHLTVKRLIEVLAGTLQLELGDLAGAEETLGAIEAQARQSGMDFIRIQALVPLGRTWLAQGDRERGLTALEAAAAASGEGPARNPLAYAWALAEMGDAAIATRQLDHAEAFLTRALAIATDPSQDNLALQARLKASLGAMYEANAQPGLAQQANLEALALYRSLNHAPMQHALQRRLEQPAAAPPAPAPQEEAAQVPAWLRDAESRRPNW